ncbi:DUF4037 domain-containing protein [Nonomuraea ferruginea]
MTLLDWLSVPWQRLAEVTQGEVFHDGLPSPAAEGVPWQRGPQPGGLEAVRGLLRWYPQDVWRYVLACQWRRIAEEEAFVGRCGEVGDELGSAVEGARLVREVMRLALLLRRRYPRTPNGWAARWRGCRGRRSWRRRSARPWPPGRGGSARKGCRRPTGGWPRCRTGSAWRAYSTKGCADTMTGRSR